MHLFSYTRNSVALDGIWQVIPDPYEKFEDENAGGGFPEPNPTGDKPPDYNVDNGYSIHVPSSWGEEMTEFRQYEGWMWHTKRFSCDVDDDRVFLNFGAVNYEAAVWLNGQYLGRHEGGYTPFSFEITDSLQEDDNLLVVRVNNERKDDGIPELQTDWFNYGGIFRSVELVSVPEDFIRNYKVTTSLSEETVQVDIDVWIDGTVEEGKPVEFALPSLDIEEEIVDPNGNKFSKRLSIPATDVDLWSPSDPTLYELQLIYGNDSITDRVGLRDVDVRDGDILVNGEKIWLRGISLHEEEAGKGRALDPRDVETRFQWLTELNCNFARLAHYPHTQEMARTADEEGIILWEEVPAYWDINFSDETVQSLYRQQIRELIQRDWSRPSVMLWSIANETDHEDPVRNDVLTDMTDYVRELDDSRLVTAACYVDETDDDRLVVKDPLAEYLDVVGINQYYGWYYGEASDMESFQENPNGTPVIVSETGGGAKWGLHGDTDDRWTEEFQEAIYRDQIDAIADNQQIVGLSPWILFDFRTPHRQNEYQRGFNRKGILDQSGRKKRAFFTLKEFYRQRMSE